MIATCPSCGKEFVFKRRPIGSGTQVNPDKPLTDNDNQLLKALEDLAGPVTIREISAYLYNHNMAREGRAWNYHLVQLGVSQLVGRGMVKAFATGKRPHYVHTDIYERRLADQPGYQETLERDLGIPNQEAEAVAQ